MRLHFTFVATKVNSLQQKMQFKCEKTAKLGKKDLRGAAFQNMELA
jgi:hypothetical protein